VYKIAVSNEKGGVAKTTTTVSLGATLAEAEKKVLLIDLDAQANLSLSLGVEGERVKASISKALLDSTPLTAIIQPTGIPNLALVPSNHEMGLAERFLPIQHEYELALSRLIKQADLDFDYILMDCPPFLGAVTLNALVAANLLMIPTQAEYFSIYALRSLMNWVRRIRLQYNPGLVYRLLLTMFDRRNRTHRLLSEQLRTSFAGGVLETYIETDTKLRESPIAGVPVILHAPKTRSSMQYRSLAQEIIAYVEETTVQPA